MTIDELEPIEQLNLADLKAKSPKDLLAMAEELEIENASTMRKGDMMFQILREQAEDGQAGEQRERKAVQPLVALEVRGGEPERLALDAPDDLLLPYA